MYGGPVAAEGSNFPPEIPLAQAASILGVDRKTVVKYLNAGLLEWRDIAPPGSSRPAFRLKLESVTRMRTSYRTGPIRPMAAGGGRPLGPSRREFRHFTLRRD